MRALARLAATDAGNDMDAAYVLAWVMLPAAVVVVPCVQHLDPENVDKVIASNLWIVVRSFRHRVRRGDVAGSPGAGSEDGGAAGHGGPRSGDAASAADPGGAVGAGLAAAG